MTSHLNTTTWHSPAILSKLQTIFPDVTSFEIIGEIIEQANAVGLKLELKPFGQRIFYKVVDASTYVSTKKDWADLRRTLLYARTEARFYRDILPDLQKRGFQSVPKVYLSEYDLDGWIGESELSTQTADPAVDKRMLPSPDKKGGTLILECVSDESYYQDSPLTIKQCKLCLEAVAALHASSWQDHELLAKAETILSKASFHLETRNPKELDGIVDAWNGFYNAFKKPFEDECNLVWTDSLRDMGRRMQAVASFVSQTVSPKPSDPFATIIHGDYKSMNVFLPKDATKHSALLVDWASTGIGLGMSDLAMHIHHAVMPDQLEGGGEEALVRHYWQHLISLIETEYSWGEAWRHYQYGVIDYFRFFLARMWKGASPETLNKKKNSKNVSLINRNIPAACAFLVVADKFLKSIENERTEGTNTCTAKERK